MTSEQLGQVLEPLAASHAIVQDVLLDISFILQASRCGIDPARVLESYNARIFSLLESGYTFAKNLRENILSADYHVITPLSGSNFDVATMVDCYAEDGDEDTQSQGRVVCTTTLGLLRVTSVKDPGSVEGVVQEQTWLIKPKVLLESGLDLM